MRVSEMERKVDREAEKGREDESRNERGIETGE